MRKAHRLVGLLVALSVAACGSDEAPGQIASDTLDLVAGETAGGAPRGIPAVLRLGEPRFVDFDAMVEQRVIRAVTTFSRTNFFLEAGRPRGATYEGLMEFEKFVNQRLGSGRLRVHVVVVPVERDQLIPALVDGRADLAAANLTITPGRLEQVDFSDSVASGIGELVVTGPRAPGLDRLEDLSGKDVYVRRSSSYHESLSALSERLYQEGLEPIRIREVDEILETEDILELVAAGSLPMTVADSHLAAFWADIYPGLAVREDLAVGTGRSIGWAFRKDSPGLAAEVNAFVRGHKKGSLFGNVLMKRYFKENVAVRDPLDGGEIERLREYRGYFERYAEVYGLDWVLVAAQAYQESRFDQTLTSSHGAVGIMQIKPTTAADKNVGIPDISTAERNIEAGMKYLRFLRDRYFRDEGMDPLNEVFFALAAYNAGPARVARFRRDAEAKGLDPNVWFRQVEQLAARQTVDYVGNIFRYWVAYREHFRRQEALAATRG